MSVNVSNAYKYFGGEEGGGGELQPEDFHELKMNGGNVTRKYDVFHGLEVTFGSQFLKKNGHLLGEYNPLVGDGTVNLPTDASDDTSTFTKASGDTSAMVSGGKLSALFTAISSFFASLLSSINNFKTKQTAVSVTGGTLKGVASMSQNANGEVTLTLNDIQDGTTAQKGVVQLQDSIGSTESATNKAVTPHAVREAISTAVSSAYHAAGTKTVAQLTRSLLVAGNEGSVYNITDSGTTTSDFVDGAGHPINAGDNVGVCNAGGGVYKFDLLSGFVDLRDYLTKTGNASDTTSVLTKNASDGSSMASGNKLSVLFTAISDFFASLKALAFKDKVSDSDISGTISNSHIASVAWSKVSSKPTKLSDFTDDITKQTYIASGTGSDKPASGAAVAQAVAKSYAATMFSGGSTKSFKAVEVNLAGATAANCLLGILEVQEAGTTSQCMFDINAVYTVSSHTVGTVVSELCWIKSKTNKIKLAYSIDTTTDKLIIYVKNLYAWNSAQIRVLTAQAEGRNSLGYVTVFDNTSVTLPDSAVEFTELDSRDASWINSGTFGTDRIADDAITAAKVKDNETLPVNVSGTAGSALTLPRGYVKFNGSVTGYKNLATIDAPSTSNEVIASFDLYETVAGNTFQNYRGMLSVRVRNDGGTYSYGAIYTGKPFWRVSLSVKRSDQTKRILIYIGKQDEAYCGVYAILRGASGWGSSYENGKVTLNQNPDIEDVSGYLEIPLTQNLSLTVSPNGAGSASTPVYVDSDGQVQPCDSIELGTPKHSATITSGAGVVYYTSPADTFAIAINYDRPNSKAYITVNNASDRQLYVSLHHSNNLTPVAHADNVVIVGTTSEYNLFDLDILCMGIGDEMPVFSFTIGIQVNESRCTYTIYDRMKYHL